MRVRVFTVEVKGQKGYDVEVLSPEATVQDYLDGLNRLIEEGGLARLRCAIKLCAGCDRCCAERIPLTSIDVFQLRQAQGIGGNSLYQVLSRCAEVEVESPWVDITLSRDGSGACLFLNKENRHCKIYAHRPLVCQTFICSPATERAKSLRSTVVNTGEDELVRLWLMEGMLTGSLLVNKGGAKDLSLTDWEENPFTGKLNYGQILLKDLCPEKLWSALSLQANCP